MNPETAKQTIQAYLDLGTLQGVKVEYDDDFGRMFYRTVGGSVVYTAKCNRRDMEQALNNSSSLHSLEVKREGIFDGAVRVTPIPLQPKLLEVDDRVKVIGGRHEGTLGDVASVREGHYTINFDNGIYELIEIYNVVPESLLVEEEESEAPLCQCSSILAALIRGEITKEEATQKIIKHEVQLAKHVLDGGFKTNHQAGYKVTKE